MVGKPDVVATITEIDKRIAELHAQKKVAEQTLQRAEEALRAAGIDPTTADEAEKDLLRQQSELNEALAEAKKKAEEWLEESRGALQEAAGNSPW